MHIHIYIYKYPRVLFLFFSRIYEDFWCRCLFISQPVASEFSRPLRQRAWPLGRAFCCSTTSHPLCHVPCCEGASPMLRAGSRNAGRWGAHKPGMSWTWFDQVVSETSGALS